MKPMRFSVNKVLDSLHRGAVLCCVGVTAYGLYLGGLRVHRYYTVIRPAYLEKQRVQQLELLEEGKDSQEFLPEAPSLSKLQ